MQHPSQGHSAMLSSWMSSAPSINKTLTLPLKIIYFSEKFQIQQNEEVKVYFFKQCFLYDIALAVPLLLRNLNQLYSQFSSKNSSLSTVLVT